MVQRGKDFVYIIVDTLDEVILGYGQISFPIRDGLSFLEISYNVPSKISQVALMSCCTTSFFSL